MLSFIGLSSILSIKGVLLSNIAVILIFWAVVGAIKLLNKGGS